MIASTSEGILHRPIEGSIQECFLLSPVPILSFAETSTMAKANDADYTLGSLFLNHAMVSFSPDRTVNAG